MEKNFHDGKKISMNFPWDFHSMKFPFFYNNPPINLNFEFYFPVRIINSKYNIDFIKNSSQNDILCDDLNHILYEVYKYLKLSIYDSVKMDIYDEKFHPIVQESQLLLTKKDSYM